MSIKIAYEKIDLEKIKSDALEKRNDRLEVRNIVRDVLVKYGFPQVVRIHVYVGGIHGNYVAACQSALASWLVGKATAYRKFEIKFITHKDARDEDRFPRGISCGAQR